MNREDTDLVEKMKQGDRTAFDSLYEKYSTKILRSAYLLTGDYQLSEDILQETFVKCFLHAGKLRDNERFEVWLIQIMHRTAWKMLKETKREVPDEEIESTAEQSDGSDCLTTMLRQEQRAEIGEALKNLDRKHREVAVLYYFNQLSVGEIARATGQFEGTVKSRLYQARKLLKQRFGVQKTEQRKQSFTSYKEEKMTYEARENG